jgi:hypothetical protein
VQDGTFDLAMFEAYTVYPPAYGPPPAANVSAWYARLEYARSEGWLNRSIACLGMLFARSALNPTGWTQPQLRATVQQLKDAFPEMPGIGFCATPRRHCCCCRRQMMSVPPRACSSAVQPLRR